ncbi:hypothetical protein C3L33_20156, partial [Rhododendron williamsianum]
MAIRLEADINGVAAKIVEDFKHSEEFPATGEKAVKRFKTSEELSIGFAKEFANGFELSFSQNSVAAMDCDGILLGMGNPLLDICSVVDQDFLDKYSLSLSLSLISL